MVYTRSCAHQEVPKSRKTASKPRKTASKPRKTASKPRKTASKSRKTSVATTSGWSLLTPDTIVYSTDEKRTSENAVCKLGDEFMLHTAVVDSVISTTDRACIRMVSTSPMEEWMDMAVMYGVVRSGAALDAFHGRKGSTDGWLLSSNGHTYGNGRENDVFCGFIHAGDVVTMELENGVLRYWVNGELREAATREDVAYPVQWAVSMFYVATTTQIYTE